MTTIAYRDGVLAGDTLLSYGPTQMPGHFRKVHKLGNGALYGFAGSAEVGEIMRRRLINIGQNDGILEDATDLKGEPFEAILVQPDGETFFFENRTWCRLEFPYVAMGSGKEHAMGAMHVGASAKQAVKAAITLDSATGGKVQWHECSKWEGDRSRAEQVFDA
jgi:ATP-dependent protease HslVU (ClpYQ) peptidase subunit